MPMCVGMPNSRTMPLDDEFRPRRHTRASREAALARLDWLANLMDAALVIPGTRRTVGLDAVFGLVPGIGDLATAAVSLYIVKQARELGAPRHLVVRMAGNVAVDAVFGAVPLVGDAFDVLWRANKRNMKLLRGHFDRVGLD